MKKIFLSLVLFVSAFVSVAPANADLLERICGRNEAGFADENLNKIAIDQFSALLIEFNYGGITREQIIAIIGMDAGEIAQLDALINKGANQAARKEILARLRSILHLAEGNVQGYGKPSELAAVIAGI